MNEVIVNVDVELSPRLGIMQSVPLQPVSAHLLIRRNDEHKVISAGYMIEFITSGVRGYIKADEALRLGFIEPTGRTDDQNIEYVWCMKELGFEAPVAPELKGHWIN